MIYNTVIALSLAATASAALFTENNDFQMEMWKNFMRDHNKQYASVEEEKARFANFIDNLKLADARNDLERKAGGSAVHGITKFSDLSQAEFEGALLGANIALKSNDVPVDTTVRSVNTAAGLVDWSGIYTTPVKDQGYCGSCWAFSTTEQIESDAMRTLKTTWVLSAEQITQCTKGSSGCRGGLTEAGFKYAKGTAIDLNSDYPYTSYYGKTGTCAPPATGVVKVTSFAKVSGESNMAAYVQSTGPLSVCLDASSWNSYTGGIMSVCGTDVDHCVQAVGVDASTGGYWKVRNSWGTSWGESGYIRLAYGKNTCAITNDPLYSAVAKA